MKICLISMQVIGRHKIGGFGSMTKTLARALRNCGHDVSIAVPERGNENAPARLTPDIPITKIKTRTTFSRRTFRMIDADIYHSQNQCLLSVLAKKAQPEKVHIVTARDPRALKDWLLEFRYGTSGRRLKLLLNYLYEESPVVRSIFKQADAVGVPAKFLAAKVKTMHGVEPIFLPNLEKIPAQIPRKSPVPTVCYIGRLDKRKRPQLLFEICRGFPQVHFIIIGKAEGRLQHWVEEQTRLDNITYYPYLDKNSLTFRRLVRQSWILINTAIREGLPLSFIEAAAQGCAILSHVNPDDFASEFGYWAKHDDFATGLSSLLQTYQGYGAKAHAYCRATYDYSQALHAHLALYERLLEKSARPL